MPQPEIDVLWRGEWIIRTLLESGCYHIPNDDYPALELLVQELARIRKLRVARWQQRERAKRYQRAAALRAADRGNRAVRELMQRQQRNNPID